MILDLKAEKYENPKEPIMGLTNREEPYIGFTYPKTKEQQLQEKLRKIKDKSKDLKIKEYYNCYVKKLKNEKLTIITEYNKEYEGENFRYEINPTDHTISIKTIKKILKHEQIKKVSPQELHTKIKEEIKKYVYLKNESEYDIITIYIMLTYKYLHFDFYPIIHLNGDAGSGKSQLGKIAVKLGLNACASVSATKSSFFRRIDRKRGLYFMDEKENLEEYEKELLNGCTYEGNIHTITEKKGDEFIDTNFQIYTPIIIACINDIYGATQTRTIKIESTKPPKKKRKYPIIKLTENKEEWIKIKDNLVIWSLQTSNENNMLMKSDDEMETILNNRGIDAWKLILNQSKKNSCYENIVTYIKDVYKDQLEETREGDIKYKFLEYLLKVTNGWISAKELYTEFLQQQQLTEPQKGYFTIKRMGLVLRKLGYYESNQTKKRTIKGQEYAIDKERVKTYLLNNYDFVEYEDKQEEIEEMKL